jgi:hypothetical protein
MVFFSLSIMDIAAYTMTLQTNCRDQTFVSIVTFAGVLRLFHVGLFHTVAPLCNSLRNDVASMETYSSWMNCPKEKCASADLMHLFLVRFVTVRLTYIFIDYPDCEHIIILNTSIVIYDFWRLSVLRSSTPSMPIFGNRHRQKSLFVDKYENDTHAPVYYQYDTYVAEFHKKRKMYALSVADK